MIKKFINGLVFGAGFTVSFLLICYLSFFFIAPKIISSKIRHIAENVKTISSVPLFKNRKGYLGSTGSFSSEFHLDKNRILASGPGVIRGKISVNGSPEEGIKLRLALNGNVLSQWAVTNSTGEYIIQVPYGKYRIDGYELDKSAADNVLGGKIDHPQNPHSGAVQYIDKENEGYGLNFKFIDPVIKKIKKRYPLSEDIVLAWEPYPGASQYSIQLFEKTDPNIWSSKTVFPYSKTPVVSETEINLTALGISLKPNHFYILQVYAKDKNNTLLSESPRIYDDFDFVIKK